jgi:hypothetical protein
MQQQQPIKFLALLWLCGCAQSGTGASSIHDDAKFVRKAKSELKTASFRSCRQHRGADALACELGLQNASLRSSDAWWLNDSNFSAWRVASTGSAFGGWPETSALSLGFKDTVPNGQSWGRCEYCALEHTIPQHGDRLSSSLRVVLFDPRGRLAGNYGPGPLVVTSSKWRGFFHAAPEQINSRFAQGSSFRDAVAAHGSRESERLGRPGIRLAYP